MKICRRCNEERDLKLFRKRSNGSIRHRCIYCDRECTKHHYWKNRESELQKNKEYREKNKEILAEKRRKRKGIEKKRVGLDPVKFKINVKKRLKNYKEKYPEKIRAHELLRYALKKGDVIKDDKCQMCEEEKKLEAHHENYDEPFNVVWLCRQCHIKLHRIKK